MLVVLAGTLGVVLRWSTLGAQSFWYDESFTVHLVHHDLGGVLSGVGRTESTPPLYYMLAWAWSEAFGTSEVALRSLSALLGTALVPVGYRVGAAIAGRETGAAIAALVAVNPLLVWMSQEARAYSLLVLLCAGSLLWFVRVLHGGGARALVWWSACSALALTAHYFALFAVGPEVVVLLIKARGRRRAVGAATALVAASGLALVPLALHQRAHSAANAIGHDDLLHRVAAVPKQFLLGATAAQIDALWVQAVAAVVVLLAVVLLLRVPAPERRRLLLPALVVGVTALAVPLALALVGFDYVNARNLLPALLPLLVVAAATWTRPGAGETGRFALAAMCVLGLGIDVAVASTPRLQRDDWRSAARTMGAGPPAPRAIVLEPAGGLAPLSLYLPGVAPMPANGVHVAEVWAMALTRPPGPWPGSASSLPLHADPLRVTSNYVLRRYRISGAARVTPGALAAGLFPGASASVLLLPGREPQASGARPLKHAAPLRDGASPPPLPLR